MRSTCSTFTRTAALALTLLLFLSSPALASSADDELTLGVISVKTTQLNPLYAEERDFQSLTALIYEGLVSLDDDYRPEACLAESWESSSDGRLWTFHLRENALFHDGTPVTAYDVKATLEEILRLAEESKGQYANLKYIVSSVSAADAQTVTIKAARPYYGFIYAMTFPILPQTQLQDASPSGSGPYQVSRFEPADFLYLSANDSWWQQIPAIRRVNVVFSATNQALISLYENNSVDAVITRSSSAGQYSRSTTSASLTYRTQQLETLMINNSAMFLDDANVRLAIRYAIDVDRLVSDAYQGMAVRTDTPLPQGTWMYQDDPSFSCDPDKARALLAESGWSDLDGDENGVLNKVIGGAMKNLHLRLCVYEEQDNSVRVGAANLIADMLSQVGFEIKVESVTFSEASQKLSSGNFDLCLAAFQMDAVPDPGFLLMKGNTGNYSRYRSTEMDSLFSTLRKSASQTDYENCLRQIQTQFAKDCPFLCLYYRTGAIMTRKMFTYARDVREPCLLRGIESAGN